MNNRLVIFDLDGTLVNSKDDLVDSVNATRCWMGLDALPADLVASYVGDGAPLLIRRAMGPNATRSQLEEALAYFLGYYREHMLDKTRAYPGVRVALDELQGRRIPMAILTNKPVRFSRDLVAGLDLAGFFFQIYGGNSFEEKKPHPIGVDTLIAEAGAKRDSTWMVGDSATDILTARNAGIRAVGVTYGIKPDSLKSVPPDLVLDTLAALPAHIG